MPAYNAEATLSRTVAEIDRSIVDDLVLVDDASTDRTVPLAQDLGLDPIRHDVNKGYGGNQKTCYRQALWSWALTSSSWCTPTTSTPPGSCPHWRR